MPTVDGGNLSTTSDTQTYCKSWGLWNPSIVNTVNPEPRSPLNLMSTGEQGPMLGAHRQELGGLRSAGVSGAWGFRRLGVWGLRAWRFRSCGAKARG